MPIKAINPEKPEILEWYRLYLPKHILDDCLQLSISVEEVCLTALKHEIYIAKQEKQMTKLGDL